MTDIPGFIKQKRAEGQNDSLILEELVALGADRAEVLKNLAAASVSAASSNGTVSNQTGGVGTPVQVENIQYTVKVGKMRSKVGLGAFVCALLAWVLAFVAAYFLTSLRSTIVRSGESAAADATGALILTIAFLVPVLPLFLYARKRLNKLLAENSQNVDDVFFKKSIRFHLVISLIVAVGWIIAAVYNILAKVTSYNKGISGGAVLDSVLFSLVFSCLTLFFWSYQKMTKR